jgi:hypothetical protein
VRIRSTDLFSLSPLIVAGVVAVVLLVAVYGLPVRNPFAIFLLLYIVWITANYFFEIVEFKALGNEQWPVFSIETLVAGRYQVGIVFSVIVLVAAGAYIGLRYFGMDTGARILLGASLVCMPASVALLAVTREFSAALNPVKLAAAALGMGHTYLLCLLGSAAVLVLFELAQARGGLLWYFPLFYGLFLYAYLIGSSVYARRLPLGVNAPRSPESRAERVRAETIAIRNGILTHAYGFAARGNAAGALRHIESYIATDENTVEARLWMLNEISRWERGAAALEFGTRVAAYCEERGYADEARRVRLICEHLSSRNR